MQIDTAATCNTISDSTLNTLLPRAKIKQSAYLLYPYGNSKPLHPIGQVELLCKRNNSFEFLRFQVLPASVMQHKPALLSGADSERLGLITIKSDEIFSLCKAVKPTKRNLPDDLPGYKLLPNVTTMNPPHQTRSSTNANPNDQSCNRQEQSTTGSHAMCKPPASPSKPITIPATRKLLRLGKLQKENILQEYSDNFYGLGCLGPLVHFTCKENVTPVQMPVPRVPVAKREKIALDRYEEAVIIKKVEEPTPWCSNELIKETPKKFRVCIDPSQTVNKVIL